MLHCTLISKQAPKQSSHTTVSSPITQIRSSEGRTRSLQLHCSCSRELWGDFVKQDQSFQSDQDYQGPGWDPDLQSGGFPEQDAHRAGLPAPGEHPGGVWLQRRAGGKSCRGHCVLRLQFAIYRLSPPQLWSLLQAKSRLCCHEDSILLINYSSLKSSLATCISGSVGDQSIIYYKVISVL